MNLNVLTLASLWVRIGIGWTEAREGTEADVAG